MHLVAVAASACDPNEITVAGGKRSFEITNVSDRPIEWEILDGVMVVAERENIPPGFKQVLSARLAPGDYEMTCGLLTNPRGVLHVTDSEEWAASAFDIGLREFLEPLSEYKIYVAENTAKLVEDSKAFVAAIKAGDVENAKSLFAPTRTSYEAVEPVAELFSDFDVSIDARADDYEKAEADPDFTGFHRIEYGLWVKDSTGGLDDYADKPLADVIDLNNRINALTFPPKPSWAGPPS